MPDLFKEIIPSIQQTKKNVFTLEEEYKDYIPYVVNKAMSAHYDCIFQANEMNMKSFLPKKVQYGYYLNSIRAVKRPFQGWLKKERLAELDLIREYYKVSYEKAKEMKRLLTAPQLEQIRKDLDKGGN